MELILILPISFGVTSLLINVPIEKSVETFEKCQYGTFRMMSENHMKMIVVNENLVL